MTMHAAAGARHRRPAEPERAKGIVIVVSALLLGLVTSGATWSAFNAQTSNTGNTFGAGTVAISDNDSGTAMFSVANLRPGSPESRCIRVTSTGTLPVGVRLYGATTSGTGLEAYLQLTVTRGTSTGGFGDCTGFTADTTDHRSLGAGVIYSGLLSAFPAGQATGVADPTAAWAQNESHWYRFTVDVADDPAAEGKSAVQTFTWDAR